RVVKLRVSECALFAGLALPEDRGPVPHRAAQVPIQAVEAGVQLAAHEPPGARRLPHQHLLPGPEPGQLAGAGGPERLGIPGGLPVDGGFADVRLSAEVAAGTEDAVFTQQDVDTRPTLDGRRLAGQRSPHRRGSIAGWRL